MVHESKIHIELKKRAIKILKRLGCTTIKEEYHCACQNNSDLGPHATSKCCRYIDVYGKTNCGREIFVECIKNEFSTNRFKHLFKNAPKTYIILIGNGGKNDK